MSARTRNNRVKRESPQAAYRDMNGDPMTEQAWSEKITDRDYYLCAQTRTSETDYVVTIWHGVDFGGDGNLFTTYRVGVTSDGGPDFGMLADQSGHLGGYRTWNDALVGHADYAPAEYIAGSSTALVLYGPEDVDVTREVEMPEVVEAEVVG